MSTYISEGSRSGTIAQEKIAAEIEIVNDHIKVALETGEPIRAVGAYGIKKFGFVKPDALANRYTLVIDDGGKPTVTRADGGSTDPKYVATISAWAEKLPGGTKALFGVADAEGKLVYLDGNVPPLRRRLLKIESGQGERSSIRDFLAAAKQGMNDARKGETVMLLIDGYPVSPYVLEEACQRLIAGQTETA